MERLLAERWWVLLIRGLAALLFGVLTFIRPVSSLYALIIVFGVYAIVDGAFNLGMAFRRTQQSPHWRSIIFGGLASLVAGTLTLVWPAMTALVLLSVIGVWAMVTGVAWVVASVRLRKQIRGEWLLALSGVLSFVFGGLMLLFPGAGALALVVWIGAWALAFGIILTALAFRIRAWSQRQGTAVQPPTGAPLPAV
jgi:uncharacterized membrane protein HdeD (DUF308 family)